MFLLKILGSLIVITSSSLIGFTYGSYYSKRLKNLMLLSNSIQLLETEVMFTATPIPEALENVYKKGNKRVSYIFLDIKKHLNKSFSTNDSFNSVIPTLKQDLNLNEEDIEIFLSLGKVLGKSDRQDQQKHFKTVITQLDRQQKDAEDSKNKNEKMCKSLGVLGGILITIILF
ncbi:stage III sporulation protein SpoIIIAB [Sporosalibacterium faouarense]|uniref:stage III sporulation protein SpoIIIAB n=1 Tax=Sporosalibacterium faouarense TaxID=516123 RepID=UPI00141CE3B8|nr:stage III sporulation protein SpoIIIAB [Sporosalibacterium faouarense]MTI48203.1 stage III sporulation protein AB [Bacillota bacterium]